jgi:rhamnogalacturonyl hydrolase YesR
MPLKQPFLYAIILLLFIGQQRPASASGYRYDNLPFEMPELRPPTFPDNRRYLTDFGGAGDGITLNTEAFDRAITSLSKQGGGTLVVPFGVWLTGPVVFQSNICLHLEKGALILFTPDFDAYPLVDASFEGLETKRCQSPVSGRNLINIAITGEGAIDGSGHAWRPLKKSKVVESYWKKVVASGGVLSNDQRTWYPSEKSRHGHALSEQNLNVPLKILSENEWLAVKDFMRPVLVSFVGCRNVFLSGVLFENSPCWTIHPLMCENVIIDGIMARNPPFAQNGDGVDLESCKNALIVNSAFDVGDDAVCIKSGKNENGRRRGRPTENLVVDNCKVFNGHGGFVVGSEMSGGVRNILVRNCEFLGTDVGLRFKSVRGRGGVVENIFVENITMSGIATESLLFDLYYGGKSAVETLEDNAAVPPRDETIPEITEQTPQFRNIYIRNIVSHNARRAMFFNGLPEMNIENIHLENAFFTAQTGAELSESKNISLKNISILPKTGPALLLNNVKDLTAENFHTTTAAAKAKISGTRNRNIQLPAAMKAAATGTSGHAARMADSEMQRHPQSWMIDSAPKLKWDYVHGLELLAFQQLYQQTGNRKYYRYVKSYLDTVLLDNGRRIHSYRPETYNIDMINAGRILFEFYRETGDEKYRNALHLLRRQMIHHPRTAEGGFWHKQIYPHQMWLDGIYMASPFLAQYAAEFNEPALFDDVCRQITLIAKHTHDPSTGLYRHAWDESRSQAWANPTTGVSPNCWSRSIGWYIMAIVDVLDFLPASHPERRRVIDILAELSASIEKFRDPQTGMWYQVTDKPGADGNYLESTASAMFIYAWAKGAAKGYLDASYREKARTACRQYLATFVVDNADGTLSVTNCCAVAGLGGNPYRDGSYRYYISEPVKDNDPKAIGPFILMNLCLEP